MSSHNEPHIVIDSERNIIVPEQLKKIGVQYDHNVKTVTFDCPRHWDGHDLSTFDISINYVLSDGTPDKYLIDVITVDFADDSIIHFDWTISRSVTKLSGPVHFMVCMKKTDSGHDLHWNSMINNDLYVSKGLSCNDVISDELFYSFLTGFGKDVPELNELGVATITDSWIYENEILTYAEKPIVRLTNIEYLDPFMTQIRTSNAVVFTWKNTTESEVIYTQIAICDGFNMYIRKMTMWPSFGSLDHGGWIKLN